jgi:hypothetical protein
MGVLIECAGDLRRGQLSEAVGFEVTVRIRKIPVQQVLDRRAGILKQVAMEQYRVPGFMADSAINHGSQSSLSPG